MFLLKSIRRRLVTGFTVALGFMLMMAGFAVWGLLHHQEAIDRLEHLVHHSPSRTTVTEAIHRIQLPLHLPLANQADLSQDATIRQIRIDYLKAVQSARIVTEDYWRKSEAAGSGPSGSEVFHHRRHPLLQVTLQNVSRYLDELEKIGGQIQFSADTKKESRYFLLREIIFRVDSLEANIFNNLQRLPSYDKEQNVLASLESEKRQSAALLKNVKVLLVISLFSYAVTIYCGFRWISNPLRTIAGGASRIANGDTDYRLSLVTQWDDEFAELTSNFNRMADRFQESEDNLSAKVEERSRQLVRSERLAGVGFLAAGVAHEINNPLSAISMAAESLQMRLLEQLDPDGSDTKEAMDRLEMIQRESRRCGQITRRLLDFSRNEKQEKRPNDLTTVIQEVLDMVRPMGRFSDRRIEFSHPSPVTAEINASQMKQVVLNLVANGLQATGSGGTVRIRIEEQTDWVVLEVSDDGQGMKPETIVHLFEPFYSTKETGQGTGLGLSITHRIIEDHHGTIDPFSEGPGKGSRFSVRLPRRQPVRKVA